MAMFTIKAIKKIIIPEINKQYELREAEHLAMLSIEEVTELSAALQYEKQDTILSPGQYNAIIKIVQQLEKGVPFQYITKNAWFYGYRFKVGKGCLIPRPETEELVYWILEDLKKSNQTGHLLDIGTGSGCIPITIKKEWGKISVTTVDISQEALKYAQYNAIQNHTTLNFQCLDILDKTQWVQLSKTNIIVSNPPYVLHSEKAFMRTNVLNNEPALALFVPDDDPLRYYKAITLLATKILFPKGTLYFEINESFGEDIVNLLKDNQFTHIELRNDMQGKPRMVRGCYNINS